MKTPRNILPALLALLLAAGVAAAAGRVTGITPYSIPSWFKQSFLDIEEDAAEAAAAGRHLLLFFHLKDCPYCEKMLGDSFAGDNQALIRARFDSVHINIRGQREVTYRGETTDEKAFARRIGVQYTPTLLFLDGAGAAALTVSGYRSPAALARALRYVRDGEYARMSLTEYNETRADAVYRFRAHADFADIRDLSAADAPLLVLFEDDACDECDWVHDNILNQADVKAQLRRLTAVRLDAKSDAAIVLPDGGASTMRDFARALDLHYRPGAVFFDGGREIFRVTGLLNHYHFREALRYVAIGHRRAHPTFGAYLRQRRRELLAAGENVDYSIPE